MNDILKMLDRDCTCSVSQIASMLGLDKDDVAAAKEKYEEEKVILGYKAVIDWEKTGEEIVTAMIDVKVTPQRAEGFDRVAERIYQYDEVESLYLMSGGYDLSVVIKGRTLKEVALFVAQKLSTLDGVTGTATHFILKKYKDNGVIFSGPQETQERIQMV
jgi:DNA-binding Lrp family transcriptional regulator